MKLRIKRKTLSTKGEHQINFFQHDRYLSDAHTLVGVSMGLVISLVFFFLSDEIEAIFGIGSKKWYIFSLLLSSLFAISLALYAYLKSRRIKAIEKILDFIELKKA